MNKTKPKIFIAILTVVILSLTPFVALTVDPPALVPKTGQTISYAIGDDGYYQTGIVSPSPRFTDNGNGTVTDEKTGLVWLKNATCFGGWNWAKSLTDCLTLNSGECGLTDGSLEGYWRMPNRFEMESLLDFGNQGPALPVDHPFHNVSFFTYWTSTSSNDNPGLAHAVALTFGSLSIIDKTYSQASGLFVAQTEMMTV